MNNIKELLDAEGNAAEEAELQADPNSPLPDLVKVTRGHSRTSTLQVRLNGDEMQALQLLAKARGVPASTMARSILLTALAPSSDAGAALARIESDVAALRRVIGKA